MSNLTKKAINQSFIELLEQKHLDKITVKEIVEKCGINRKTFYNYYADIHELFKEMMQEHYKSWRNTQEKEESAKEFFLKISRELRENKRIILHVSGSLKHQYLEELLYECTYQETEKQIIELTKDIKCSKEAVQTVAEICSYAMLGKFITWIADGMPDQIEQEIEKNVFDTSEVIRTIIAMEKK